MLLTSYLFQICCTISQYDSGSYKAWHAWALANYQLVSHVERLLPGGVGMAPAASTVGMTAFASMHAFSSSTASASSSAHVDVLAPHLRPAIQGFFRSIALGRDRSLQDILRLLTLWFKHGARADVEVCGRISMFVS